MKTLTKNFNILSNADANADTNANANADADAGVTTIALPVLSNRRVKKVVKYSELVHMAETHSQARASSPYELVPNILRYSFKNL